MFVAMRSAAVLGAGSSHGSDLPGPHADLAPGPAHAVRAPSLSARKQTQLHWNHLCEFLTKDTDREKSRASSVSAMLMLAWPSRRCVAFLSMQAHVRSKVWPRS